MPQGFILNEINRTGPVGLLVFGMGDLIIKTGGAIPETIRLRNVTNIDHKVGQIDKLLRAREIIQTVSDVEQEKTNAG